MGRTRIARLAISQLKARIWVAQERKSYFENYLKRLHESYQSGKISYNFYVETLHLHRDGRSIQQWIEYYDHHIKECKILIKKHTKDLVKGHVLNLFFASVFILILISTVIYIQPKFIGFAIQSPSAPEIQIPIITEGINLTESTIQSDAVLGQNVKWTKTVSLNEPAGANIILPSQAENIIIKKTLESYSEEKGIPQNQTSPSQEEFLSSETNFSVIETSLRKGFFSNFFGRITGGVIGTPGETVKQIEINDAATEYKIEYETPAPTAIEQDTERGKIVRISSPKNIHYENVLAFTNVSEDLNIKNPSSVKIYWLENNTYIQPSSIQDKDSNGIYDYVEWIAPSLSEQTFEIIIITKAEHLDSNRDLISDVYDEVKELDNIWSEPVSNNEYVRITFAVNLTPDRDITLYPRVVSGNPKIEVYEVDKNEKIAEFTNLNSNQYNKILLTNLTGNQDVFDLKVISGSVEFDHIIDPHLGTLTISGTTELCGDINNIYDKVVVTNTGVLNICARNATAGTGWVNLTLGTAGNFTVYPGGLVNGTARGGAGGAGTNAVTTTANATKGENGNNWTTGGTGPLPNGGGGGGGGRDVNSGSAGGGGGAFGGAGGTGGEAPTTDWRGEAGLIYGATNNNLTLLGGSGGGGGAGDGGVAGGKGGAGFKVDVGFGVIKIEGFVNLTGGNGIDDSGANDRAAGGGGSGGHLILYGSNINVAGAVLNVSGGSGGIAPGGADDCGGGGGGGGRIYLVYSTITNTSVTTNALAGGADPAGCTTDPTAGSAGTIRHNSTAAAFTDNAPQWFSPSTNNTNPSTGDFVRHNVNWTEDGELSFATLEVNATGGACATTANVTSDVIIGTTNWSNLTWEIPVECSGKTIGWRIYAKDWPNNQTNVTALQSYQVQATNTAPTITLNYPVNNSNISTSDIVFSAIPVDGEDSTELNVSIYGNWTGTWHLNVSNISSLNNTQTNFTISAIPDGKYIWGARVGDTQGSNVTNTTNYTFTKDTVAPTINLPFYANGTLKKNTETLTLNISVSDTTTSPSACNIDINGTNQTVTVSSGWCNITNGFLTNLADGNRTINIYANDTLNNWGLNNSFVVTIDETAPMITLPFYVNGTLATNLQTLTLNISVTDATTQVSACVVNINGTNQTTAPNSGWCNITNGFLTNLADGNATIYAWANDSLNNFGLNSSFVVKIDSTAPVITLPFYTNATKKTITSDTLTLNISVSDAGTSPSACNIDINGTNQTFSVSSGWCNITNGFLTNLADGNRTINVYANDSLNTFGINNSFVVFMDSNNPVAQFGTNPVDNVNKSNSSVTFDLGGYDGISVSYLELYGNWTGSWVINQSNSSPINATYWNITVDAIPQGKYIWAAWANDSHNNQAFTTSNRTFTIDTVAPTITLPFYENATKKPSTSDTLTLNISISDATTQPSTCNIDINGTNQTFSVSSGWCNITNGFLTNLADGNRTINVYANDSTGQFGLNNSFVVFIDATSPIAEMGTNLPDNNNRTNRSVTFDIRGYDGIFLDDIALYGNWTGSWIANQTNTSPINATYWNITVDAIPEGKYRWTAWANDSHNNIAFSSANRTLTIDLTAPVITLPFYANATIKANTETLTLNVSVSDSLSGFVNSACRIEVNGTNTTVAVSSGWCNTTSIPLTNLGEGNATINVYANDTVGNLALNNSFVVKILNNVAPTIPFVEAIPDQNVSEAGTRNVYFIFSVNDTNGASDINVSSAQATFNQTGESTRSNSSCMNISSGGNGVMFNCTIGMLYFDNAGTWGINITAKDNLNERAVNSTINFTYNLFTAMVVSPTSLNWPSPINLTDTNIGSSDDPITINNTGNAVNLSINITAYNLRGEATTTQFIFANNFTIGNATEGCTLGLGTTTTANATSVQLNGTNLSRGNNSLLYNNETSGQEQIFFCLKGVPQDITAQSYSSSYYGSWEIRIFLVALLPRRKKKKNEKEGNKLLDALDLIIDKIKEDSKLKGKEITRQIIERLTNKYKISKKEISDMIGEKAGIPSSIFTKDLGALESLVKYMKENLKMSYIEIARYLSRNERTIWTAYKKATDKHKSQLEIKRAGIMIPLYIFENKKLTILESLILYLKEKGFKFSEIADMLERDQRNIWTIHSRIKRK